MKNISKKKIKLLVLDVLLLIVLIILDQVTKYFAVIKLKGQEPFTIWDGVFQLQYLENSGAAFGMLRDQKFLFILMAIIILFVISYVLYKTPDKKKYTILHILLTLIAAGAIGNMIDRFRYDYVVDFLYFVLINFPIFNVADMYVTVSTALIALTVIFYYKEDDFGFLSFKEKKLREVK